MGITIAVPALAQKPAMANNLRPDTVAPRAMDSIRYVGHSLSDRRLRFRSIFLPTTLVAYGFVALENHGLQQLNASTKAELREDHSSFATHADNYLQFAPAVAVYALNIAGVNGQHSFYDRSVIYGLTTLLSTAIVFPMKKMTHEERPDRSNFGSFPSGHTTLAFASAEFLRQEYKETSAWYGVAGYVVATATGALRMYNNKHWLSDVVSGAGLGILSTKIVYHAYPWLRKKIFKDKEMTTMIMPYYHSGSAGVALVYHFHRCLRTKSSGTDYRGT